ncbi:MAG: oligosaccharide flippase family protein [Acidobacteriota bacterium]
MRARVISRNFAALSAGQLVSRILAFAITIYLTRILHAEYFGIIVFATSVLAYAGLIVDCGFESFGPLEVARQLAPMRELARTVVTLRLSLTAVAFAALALFSTLSHVNALTRTVLLLYGISLISNALSVNWVFMGAEMMRESAIGDILEQVVMVAGVFVFIHQPEHVTRIPWVYLTARLVAVSFLIVRFIRIFGNLVLGIDFGLLRRLIAEALPLAGTSVVAMVSHNFDLVLVGLWLGSSAAGMYGAAYRVVWAPTLIVTAYYMALRPTLARGYRDGIETVSELLRRSVRLTTALAVGIVVGGVLLAVPLVRLLYGRGYDGAIQPMQMLLVAFALVVVSRKYRLILTCFNRQGVDFNIMSAAAVVNIVANLLLIPRMGVLGAALASVISEVGILLMGYSATRLLVGHVPFWRHLLRPALGAALMAEVLVLTPSLPVLLRILLGGGVYVALLFAMRVVNMEELRMLLSSWRRLEAPSE